MADLDKSIWKIYKTLKKYNMLPYKFQRHQKLSERDKERRLNCCTEMLARLEQDPEFFSKILWSDESRFAPRDHQTEKITLLGRC